MTGERGGTATSVIIALVIIGVLALGYVGRLGVLTMNATEGDIPSASSIPLPTGSEIVGQSKDCASGGCCALISVRPPDGLTPADLSDELGTTPQARLPGSFWDPRTISLSASPRGQLLVIRADYFSLEYVP